MEEIKLEDVLSRRAISKNNLIFMDKDELFRYMVQMLYKAKFINDVDNFMTALYEREATGSTYMGDGLAVPHGKSACVAKPGVAICRCQPMVYDETNKDEEVYLAVMLAIPESLEQKTYINMLAKIARLLMDDDLVEILKTEIDKNVILDEMSRRIAIV